MAMTDYPYPTNFLMPMQAWPATAACKFLGGTSDDYVDLATSLFNASIVFYSNGVNTGNYCIVDPNEATSNLGNPLGFPWQECTELIIYSCASGPPNDVFWQDCSVGNFTSINEDNCNETFVPPTFNGYTKDLFRENAIEHLYGFDYSRTSNIIFTNGNLDPWSAGGVQQTTPGINGGNDRGIYSFYMDGSAHHLDLRQPNTCDPPPVQYARYQIVHIISCWINPSCNANYQQQPLPSFNVTGATSNDCKAVQYGYPWGMPPPTTTSTKTNPITSTHTNPTNPTSTIPNAPSSTTPKAPPTNPPTTTLLTNTTMTVTIHTTAHHSGSSSSSTLASILTILFAITLFWS
uniref:Uncharacterized protein n=1 Tax=Acrobeloides nanus TaxID=290746 RepID=A0A914CPG2_9BILA